LGDKEYRFPVAQVGLGQMGVLRRGQLEFDQHGAVLRAAARLLRQRLDPPTETKKGRSAGKRRSLRGRRSDGMLEP
jgi:hypothetical protein